MNFAENPIVFSENHLFYYILLLIIGYKTVIKC